MPLINVTLDSSATSSGASWGSITGTLSNQTDLQSALDSAGGFWDETVVQDNEQTVTNSTTLVDSDDLQITLDASSTYLIGYDLVADDNNNESSANSGFKMNLTYTGTDSVNRQQNFQYRSGEYTESYSRAFDSPETNQMFGLVEGTAMVGRGYIVTTTSGTLKLQFAQSSANASGSAYLRIGSTLSVKKVV